MQIVDAAAAYRAYKDEIDQAVAGVLDSGRFVLGSTVEQFEQELANYLDVAHVVGVANGTDAIVLALRALGIGPGDEVITTPFTFIASATAISLAGATPVFVDIDLETYCMDVGQVRAAITPRTKAILPVSLFGRRAELPDCGVPVIEDAAQSVGSNRGVMATTSFYPTKPLACFGDGGAVMAGDGELAAKLRLLRNHGSDRRDHHSYLGMNSRLDALQAAILRVRLAHLDEELAARCKIAERFNEGLAECCVVPPMGDSAWAVYTIRTPRRDELQQALQERGVPSFVYYSRCCHEQPIFAELGYYLGSFPAAERARDEVLSLPMHPWLTEKDQKKIIASVRDALLVANA